MNKKENSKGIVLMVLSMGAIALADSLVKVASAFASPAQTMFYLMGGALVVFTLLAKIQGEALIDPRALTPILLLRYFAEIGGMIGMVLALAYVPLSTVGAITQASPIVVALGAVLFLGERVSWRRWTSIGIGFLGVLLIVQPGGEAFDVTVLWAVLAMAFLSVRDLTTRLTPSEMPTASLATYTMAAALPVAVSWVLYNGDGFVPAQTNWMVIVAMVGSGAIGYILLTASIRKGELSVIMPFRYSRIIFLILLGVVFFNERPSAMMLFGTALIIVSGIYMMWREWRVKQLAEKR